MRTLKIWVVATVIALAWGLSAQPAHAFCCGFWGFSGGFHVGTGWSGWGGPWGYYPGWGGWGPYYGYPVALYPYSLPVPVVAAPDLVAQK